MDNVNAQTGPVFISYPSRPRINAIVDKVAAEPPEYDFTAEDGVIHTAWVVADEGLISELKNEFAQVEALYIADGHHRAHRGSGCRTAQRRPGTGIGSCACCLSI